MKDEYRSTNESDPGATGFRLSIPNPRWIADWLKKWSSHCGDSTHDQLLVEGSEQIEQCLRGESRRLFPGTKIWLVDVYDSVLNQILVELKAAYSLESGEWGKVTFFFYFSPEEKNSEVQWQIPAKAETILEELKRKGFEANLKYDEDGCREVTLLDKSCNAKVLLHLGFESREDAMRVLSDPDEMEAEMEVDNPIRIDLEMIPNAPEKSIEYLKYLQSVGGYAINALYHALGVEPPDILLELSEDKECL
ncbi:hypothetical protein JW796_00105 [Candidatus Dojkabacteria bacterium]|nr:hypothetical protein [Candidatus Dojkabacteria bacterium]